MRDNYDHILSNPFDHAKSLRRWGVYRPLLFQSSTIYLFFAPGITIVVR